MNYDLLSADIQEYLIRLINQHLSEMNIFCTYNVLWGLARMGASKSSLGPALSSSVLDKTVGILHTFLPTHYGDVIWSLGSLGYRQDDLSPVMSDRVLAVLSRVYGKLHVRAAAYTLWGLSKMGFQWEDMQGRTRSLAGGREADPLSESVSKYLRQRVASMKEHEYSVLLYSLGGLRVQLQGESESSLPDYVTEKIHHRATRVSTFLTSRSLANSLYGLGKCGVSWMELPIETRDAWENAMLSLPASLSPSSISNQKHGNNGDRKGLQGMRTVEFAQTLYGLGQLQVPWRNLLRSTREALTAEIQQHGRVDSMDLHGISTGLWGFAAMGCPLKEVPANLILAARKRLWAPGSVAEISALEFDRSIINQALSTPQPQVDSSTVVAAASDGKTNSAAINKDDYKLIERGEGSGRQHSSRRVVLTSLEECALSLTMGLEALAMLKAHLSQEELRGVAGRLQILAPHMGPDSIVTCTRSLSQLGALWTDLTTDTRVTWISRLKRSPGDLTAAKRQGLAESLNTMGAF